MEEDSGPLGGRRTMKTAIASSIESTSHQCGNQPVAVNRPGKRNQPADKRARILKQLNHPLVVNDYVRRTAVMKKVVEQCKKERECPHCQALNGIVKRVGSMRIIHEKFKEKDKTERAQTNRREFHTSF